MEPVEITAGRLHLRPWQPDDAPAVLAACVDPEIQRWTTVPSPYTGRDARAFVEDLSPRGWADGTCAQFAVLDATSGRLLAAVGLDDVAHGSAEVGFWAVPRARGRGVVTDAVGAVCRWGFGALGLQRVLWQAEVGNLASRAVAEKAGFTVEATLRAGLPARDGSRVDAWAATLLSGDQVRDRRSFGGSWTDLVGEGLTLRRWREDDLGAVLAGLSDAESARWLDVPVPYSEADGRAWLEATWRRWVDGLAAPLAVEVDGAVAGLLILLPTRLDAAAAELGWWTVPASRGRGVTARAVRVMLPWAASLGLRRLEALVDPRNTASRRTAERAGLVAEGVRRAGLRPVRHGPRRDGLVYALVLDDLAAGAPVR